MRNIINIFVIGVIQFTACADKNIVSSLEKETAKRIFSKYTDNQGDNIYGVGEASPNRGSLQRDIAVAYAQNEIQKQIYTVIDDGLIIVNREQNGKTDTTIKNELKHKIKGELRGAKIIDSYRGASGTLYVLMKYNFKEYVDSISSLSIKPNFLSPQEKREIGEK